MSSYLKILSSAKPLPTDLDPLGIVLWSNNNVDSSDIGYASIDSCFLDLTDLPYGMYEEFKHAIDKIKELQDIDDKDAYNNILVPTEIIQSLWNENTLSIIHQRLGPITREQWIEYTKTVTFYVCVS